MKKAVQLQMTVWIEGEDEPAHNFAASSMEDLKDILSAGRWRHPGLKVTVKKIIEDANYDDAAGADKPTQ